MPPKCATQPPRTKIAKTESSDASATSLDTALPAPPPTSGHTAQKRSRTIEPNRIEVEADSSVVSVSSETPTAITVEDDPRAASETNPAARTRRAPQRRRQTTLTGGLANVPEEAMRRGHAKSHIKAVTAASSDKTTGGELKPSLPTRASTGKRTGSKGKAASAVLTPALDGPGAAPLLERALLAHLRNALVLYAVMRSKRGIGLTTVPSSAKRTDPTDAYAADGEAVENAAVEQPSASSENVPKEQSAPLHLNVDEIGEEPAETKKKETAAYRKDADDQQGFLALPCVQYFILKECARLAHIVREEGGNGYGSDPATRALELLGFFLSMVDAPGSFAALLVLACPSCRSLGINADAMSQVAEFLMLSQRVNPEDIPFMSQAKACETLGLLDGCRDSAGVPVEPLRCCPYGEAHVSLQLLLIGWANTHGSVRNRNVRYSLVPFQIDNFPAIAEAARKYHRKYEEYTTLCETRYTEQRMACAEVAPRRLSRSKDANPPELPKNVRELLETKAGGVTWAEKVFRKILSDTIIPEMQHLCCSELQARIRTVYAYTQTDVLGRGGYFKLSLHTPSSYFRRQTTIGVILESEMIFLQHLFSFMKVFQHIAEGILHRASSDDHSLRCLCRSKAMPSSPSFLLVEEHIPYVTVLRRCREEQYLLVDESEEVAEAALCNSQATVNVDVEEEENDMDKNDAAALVGGDISYYAAGSFSRHYATLDLVGQMNPGQVVDYVTRVATDSVEALPVSAVPRAYIHAELKRHQLEDVQWMWNKETEGYREHVQVPLYRIRFHGAALRPVVQRTGTMFYCATTRELIVERGTATQMAEWGATGNLIRGGLLCDDVGLGKTLSVLTLCAYDRAMRESNAADDNEGNDARFGAAESYPNRFWQVTTPSWAVRNMTLAFNPAILRWGFGPGTFRGDMALYTIRPTNLPRTTLVVVPLSITAQWIEELQKFYPKASYILFYGAKRTQYTLQDLQRADFVITTYETLSTHLRQETDGLRHWLSRSADVVDDRACVEVASRGWQGCRPSHLNAALQTFASSTVWSQLPNECPAFLRDFNRSRVFVLNLCSAADADAAAQSEQGRGRGGCGGRDRGGGNDKNTTANAGPSQDENAPPPLPQMNVWTFEHQEPLGLPRFNCPLFSLRVLEGDPTRYGNGEVQQARPALYHRLCADESGPVSDAFLDDLWKLLKDYATATDATPDETSHLKASSLFDFSTATDNTESFLTWLFRTEERYPMSDHIRRLVVRHILLPPLWQPLQMYWEQLEPHYASVATAELTGHMPLRIVDLLFHRVVLDESQKCGTKSLFHLLLAERRWAVTGTPLNNNKIESLGTALSFLGMSSAAQLLSRTPQPSLHIVHTWIGRHTDRLRTYIDMLFSRFIHRSVTRMAARLRIPFDPNRGFQEPQFCFCAICTQAAAYGVTEHANNVVPLECRHIDNQHQFAGGSPCLPNVLMEVLALTMVRHERNQHVNCELQLPPVRYSVHRADLGAEEMTLYDRVARVVMQVAARFHRQGVLGSRMGYAMQWAQELCRLCLHPSRVGDAELLRGDVEALILRGVRFAGDEESPALAEFAASVAATFISATAQEALDWAQSLASRNTERTETSLKMRIAAATNNNICSTTHGVPEETVIALNDLKADPPMLPLCGVCMDDMVTPTLLNCFHLFCKECVMGVIDASRSFAGNVNAKCPYCRDRKSLLEEKRVITVGRVEMANEEPTPSSAPKTRDKLWSGTRTADDVDDTLARIGDGSRVRAFVDVVKQIWSAEPGDGVLVFSKYPAFLQLAHDAIKAAGYAPYIMRGVSTLVQRQRVMRALQQPGGSMAVARRILFVTSRSANAGLNLTFANHVIFLEPNLNPAMERQAVGRVHRFGQLKQVIVHHLYAPRTIEDVIYHRSVRLREQAAQQPVANAAAVGPAEVGNGNEMQRRTQFGRIAPAEISLLLEYPVPPQNA